MSIRVKKCIWIRGIFGESERERLQLAARQRQNGQPAFLAFGVG